MASKQNTEFSDGKRKAVIAAIIIAFAAFLTVMTVFFIVPERKADKIIALGDSALSDGNTEEALSFYEEASDMYSIGKKAQAKIDSVNKSIEESEIAGKLTVFHYNYMLKWNALCKDADNGEAYVGNYDTAQSPADQMKVYSAVGGESQSWADYLTENTIDYLTQLDVLYKYAVKNGYKLDKDDKADVEASIARLTATAQENNLTFEQYVENSYGKSISLAEFRAQLEKEKLVSIFSDEWTQQTKKTYTDEKIEKIYKSNPGLYDKADLRVYRFDSYNYGDQAKAYAKKIRTAATTEDYFIDYVMKFSLDDTFASREDADAATQSYGIAKTTIAENLAADAADWAFDSLRMPGDTEYFEVKATEGDYTYYYVLFVVKPAYQDSVVSVRHIYLSTVGSDGNKLTGDALKAVDNKLNEIKTQWNAGKKTEDEFAALAKKYSDDDSASKGGLAENIVTGQMPNEFDKWIFDKARKYNDFTTVTSEYGYHFIFFIETDEEYTAEILVTSLENDFDEFVAELTGEYSYLDATSDVVKKAQEESVSIIDEKYLSASSSPQQ